ncbi:Uncharacterised protein [Mycobacteroides abscessus subsp. abscessus]|nr:Uncharacterised protein [Mycobacteroides abscessus subsp. abscessus]
MRSDDVVGGDAHGVAGVPHDFAVERAVVFEFAQSDLGSLKVGEDADGLLGVVAGLAHSFVDHFVVVVRAVAEIESRDVHSGVDEFLQPLFAIGSWTQGADDLGSAFHCAHLSPLVSA